MVSSFLFEFGFVFFAQALFFQLVFFGLQHELRVQIAQFALFFGNGFGDFQLFFHVFRRFQRFCLRFQLGNQFILLGDLRFQTTFNLGGGKFAVFFVGVDLVG